MHFSNVTNCRIETRKEMRWGALYHPLNSRPGNSDASSLRVMVLSCGHPETDTIQTLLDDIAAHGTAIEIVGYVTDDPLDTAAKISAHKRLWRVYSEEMKHQIVKETIERAVTNGIPVYTGAIKTDYFRALMADWRPDVTIVNGLGQRIDQPIIDAMPFGSYNAHPSDLSKGIGKGVNPYSAVMDRGLQYSRVTLHQVTEDVDSGPIVGLSPEVRVTRSDGSYPSSLLDFHIKLIPACFAMHVYLLRELAERKATGLSGPLDSLNFDEEFPEPLKESLLSPIRF